MNLKKPFDRITSEPGKLGAKPCIRGYRIGVEDVLFYLANYSSHAELLKAFPELEEEDLRQAVAYATATMRRRYKRQQAA
jgi:uncharacterized protein (DUF433 family)